MEDSENSKEEKKIQPENEIKPEVKSFDDEIEQKAAEMQEQHGDKFNTERFKSAAREYAEKNGNINGINADSFVEKDKKDGPNRDAGGKCYHGGWENGKFVWTGPNGEKIEGKDYAEAEDKFNAALVEDARKRGVEPKMGTYWGPGVPESEKREHQRISSKSAIKHGVTIIAGWPEDRQFWKNLKDEYLKDENHTLADWEKMTRKIPDDVMSRTPEERARVKKLNDAELLKAMRRGNNPYLNPQENKPQQPANTSQNNNNKGKTLTAEQMKALSGRGGQSL